MTVADVLSDGSAVFVADVGSDESAVFVADMLCL